ncbi:MAG TPA: sigma-70 family RNA polymerase sigma factor [Steroidobacteraceae bacterium]|nr:sigma-70 family RNA polymerase sigma factor [Steroidobacteraceae bacterium]
MNTDSSPEVRADELLAIRCQLGERDAFDALIARWHEPIWRYLRRLTDSDDAAADLAQDTWLKVLRGIATLREPASLRAWLFGIARRVAMDRLRRQYARPLENDAMIEDIPAQAADADLERDLAALDTGVDSLPLRERETVSLFYLRELTIEQIAGLLGVPAGTVKSRLFRARNLLRKRLTGDRT